MKKVFVTTALATALIAPLATPAAAAPLNNTASIKGGPYSSGTYPASGTTRVEQYGRIVVTDSGPTVSLAFNGYSSDNTSRISMTKTYNV